MSSLYVRDTVRGWLTSAPGLVLPFVDTVNREANPQILGAPWATLAFMAPASQPISYCGLVEERGTFDYIALGPPGKGDHDLVAAAENDVAVLLQQVDPAGRLTLFRASPPDDFLQGGAVPWYTVSMVIEYQYIQPLAGATVVIQRGANHAAA
jgi:hypothetical protein